MAQLQGLKSKSPFGHPAGLYVLFFTEMWERFSFYGMRSLLVLYMTQHLIAAEHSGREVFGFESLRAWLEALYGPLGDQALASQLYGLYTGFVYFTPFFGGILADRLLGPHKCIIVGAVSMAIGHFLMAAEAWFLPALLFLIIGSGCFKPNISTQVGNLYPHGDSRRDGAFTLFYMGINLGAFFSPLICGTLGQRYGWHFGFTAAGLGMLLALIIYLGGQKYLIAGGLTARPESANRHAPAAPLTPRDWRVIGGLVILATLNILFWAVYEQQGNTLQLFAEHDADRRILGWEMPSTWFQSLNPAFIFLLAPLIDWLSSRRNRNGPGLSSIAKMAIGAGLLGAAFLVLIFAIVQQTGAEKIGFAWLVLCTFIYTLGELYLSPIGLSLVSKVSPPRLTGMLMGMWFLSSFFGNYLSGYIGGFYGVMPRESFFMLLAALAMTTGLAIFALKPFLKKAVGEV